MRKMVPVLLLLAMLFGSADDRTPSARELTMWVTTQQNAEIYQELAEKWNAAHQDNPIRLSVSVYTSQRIAGKLDRVSSIGTSFSGNTFPDLMEISYAALPDFVFPQTTELYPLKHMLDKNGESAADIPGACLYSSNEICFALPYQNQQLVLCYRLELEQQIKRFQTQASSFEGLAKMGRQYASQHAQPLLMVDYLGSETFLALFVQAMQGTDDSRQAYDAAVRWLRQAEQSGAVGYLSSGDAYSASFQTMLQEGSVNCVVTTQDNLRRLAQADASIGRQYGVLPLPSFQAQRCTVYAPTVAAAVSMGTENVILARNFLEFCRFSGVAEAYPTFALCKSGQSVEENLSALYPVSGKYDAPQAKPWTGADLKNYLTEYSDDVLRLDETG